MINKLLLNLYHKTRVLDISDTDKIIIFSDLHMGNRKRQDDFRKNAQMFSKILKEYYFERGYTLILNGDIEELLKFSLRKITKKWPQVFNLYKKFADRGRFYKIWGNHDFELPYKHDYMFKEQLYEALRLRYKGNLLFLFHGHQASNLVEKYNNISSLVLRYIAKPIGLKNASTAYNSKRKYSVEKRIYEFSTRNRIVSIIGHTHRPMFESLSKEDTLKYQIEQLVRDYPTAEDKDRIKYEIDELKKDLQKVAAQNAKERTSLYNSTIVIPCLFNSGTVIGKRGITALEILDGEMQLVYWYNRNKRQRRIKLYEEGPFHLPDTHLNKIILKKDRLDYIFTKMQLLAG